MSEEALNVDYAISELRYNGFMLPAYRSALAALDLRSGMQVLDVGCGPGGLFPLLGEAVGPQGHITGVDGSQIHLDAAQEFAQQQGVQTPLTLVQADLRQPTEFADDTFDCAWCADVLWANIFPDPMPVVRELVRVVKPGSIIAIFFGNFYRAQYLPGYRRLEWLAGTAENMRWKNEAPYTTPSSMTNTYERALQWLQASGLQDCAVSIHPLLYQQPLPAAARDYLEAYVFAEAFGPAVQECGAAVGMSDAERTRFQELTTPGSPDYLLDQPDYYCLQTSVLATGRVAEVGADEESLERKGVLPA
ncbi:MAG: methyltransferase domain-containing protein [Caldilineaceae bacterium]